MNLRKLDSELNEMVLEGRAMEAFDKFYADDVVMREGSEEPTVGKDANRRREADFFGAVNEVRDFRLKHAVVGDGVTMSVWHLDYTHEEWGDVKMDQVAVRRWNDAGQVAEERFFKG